MRGRKPTPLAKRLVEGDTRKVGVRKLRALIAEEPKASRGLPNSPAHLEGLAQQTWDFWREELEQMNLDCRPDAMMLEGACVAYGRAVEADMLVTRHGLTVKVPLVNREGVEVGFRLETNPAISISNAAWKNVKAFCSEFGLSPVSRTRLTLEKKDSGAEDLKALLSAPRSRAERVQ